MRKYLTEFIGTFFLLFTIYCVVVTGSALAPLAIGGILAAMVFAGGHISGAHYNPAVSVAAAIRGKLPVPKLLPYVSAQLIGAVAGAAMARLVVGTPPGPALNFTGRDMAGAFVAELLVTFALAYVVLNVATSQNHPNNSFYGLAIGITVAAGVVAVGGASGGVFNPAVAVATSVSGLTSWSMLGVYLAATLAGGALAGVAFRVLNPADIAVPIAVGTEVARAPEAEPSPV